MIPSATAERPPAIAFSPPVPLEALAERAWMLDPPSPHELSGIQRPGAAELIDPLLTRVARGRGALDVAMGEGLAALSAGDGFVKLGYSCLADYAREVLGVAGRTAQGMVRLARGLEQRPLLKEAVRRGEVSARKAQAVLPVALGETEAGWVERARVETVRALEAAVREELRARAGLARTAAASTDAAALGDGSEVAAGESSPSLDPSEETEWERVVLDVSEECRPKLEEALSLAGRLLGATSPRWQRLEAICQEYLGTHPEAPDPREKLPPDRPFGAWVGNVWVDGLRPESLGGPVSRGLEPLEAWLEVEMKNWWFLEKVESVEAPRLESLGTGEHGDLAGGLVGSGASEGGPVGGGSAEGGPIDPRRVDAELRSLAALRERWDEVLGHLAMLVRYVGLWQDAKFASFAHYCEERLGMAARTVEQRVWLTRRLYDLPGLRQAMREGRVSYEKARIVAGCATEETLGAWIEKAEKTTCIALRRGVEADDDRQMCARGAIAVFVPRRVGELLATAFRTVRAGSTRWLLPSECLQVLAEHFIETWKHLPKGRSTPQKRAIERDQGWCQVPGCSKPAAHAHHVWFRSRGGGDEEWNLVGLCLVHHLRGVHMGWLRVSGVAPEGLVWELRVPLDGWVEWTSSPAAGRTQVAAA